MGSRLLPLEQVERRPVETALVLKDVRVPLDVPVNPECAAGLRECCGVHERLQLKQLAVESERCVEIAAVYVDVHHTLKGDRHGSDGTRRAKTGSRAHRSQCSASLEHPPPATHGSIAALECGRV